MGNHRAQRAPRRRTSATTPATSVAGKRRATPVRKPLVGTLPSVPLVAGVAVLAIATTGAVSVADDQGIDRIGSHAPVTAASIGAPAADALANRDEVVSRGATRDVAPDGAAPEEIDPALEGLMAERTERYQARLAQMRRDGDKQAAKIKENRWVLPLNHYNLTATFGQYGLWASYHTGLDFNGDSGDPIMAIANGTITETGYAGAYGNKTVLTLDDGTEIWYAHQTSIHVSVGQRVNGGDVIGTVGSTGNSTGSHLHLEVRPGGGGPIDPFQAFVQHGIVP